MAGYRLSQRAVEATAKVVGRELRQTAGSPRGRNKTHPAAGTRYQGVLASDLAAPDADQGWTSPTTATMTVYGPDPASAADPVEFVSKGFTIDIVNRDSSLEAEAGTFAKAEFLNGEWSLYWVSC